MGNKKLITENVCEGPISELYYRVLTILVLLATTSSIRTIKI